MALPTLAHLRSIGIDGLTKVNATWHWQSRKPWRISSTIDGECLRGPLREKTPGYPDGLPGLPYGFNTAKDAIEFRNGCLEKLKRSLG